MTGNGGNGAIMALVARLVTPDKNSRLGVVIVQHRLMEGVTAKGLTVRKRLAIPITVRYQVII